MSKELVGLRSVILKRLCFIKHFFPVRGCKPNTCDSQHAGTAVELWPITAGGCTNYLSGGSCDDEFRHLKKSLKNKMQNKCNCSGSGQCKRTSFRPLIGTLPRGELAEMADNTFQRFLVCWRAAPWAGMTYRFGSSVLVCSISRDTHLPLSHNAIKLQTQCGKQISCTPSTSFVLSFI